MTSRRTEKVPTQSSSDRSYWAAVGTEREKARQREAIAAGEIHSHLNKSGRRPRPWNRMTRREKNRLLDKLGISRKRRRSS